MRKYNHSDFTLNKTGMRQHLRFFLYILLLCGTVGFGFSQNLTAVSSQRGTPQPDILLPVPAPTLPVELRGTVQPWPVSTPEEQGMDSTRLAAMLQAVRKDGRNIHSILIARHGVVVLEVYFPPFNRETPHNLYSCTKSVTSAAVGLALRDGLVDNLDIPAYTFFPDVTPEDEDRKGITLRHLLTMSSGLEWTEPVRSGLSDNWALTDSASPAEYFFSRPVAAAPGTVFNYNSGASHLLSLVVADVSAMKTADYVAQSLFTPLGIDRYEWLTDANKQTLGGTGLALAPADMLRFGQLYLQKGAWGGEQILLPSWVEESTQPHIDTDFGVKYGFQWWVRPNGIFSALGWGGQEIIIAPKQDMVIVFTAGIRDVSWNTYDDLLNTYILPAARSFSALPPNSAGNAALQNQIREIQNPPVEKTAELPSLAARLNGTTFVDLNGTHGWSAFQFHFDRPDVATLQLMYGDKSEEINALIGLDGQFRVTETSNYGPLAFKGYWKDGKTFVLTQQLLREAERLTMELTFEGNKINRITDWTVENHREESDAEFLGKNSVFP